MPGTLASRAERAARLIHSAREAVTFNGFYVADSSDKIPALFVKEMLR